MAVRSLDELRAEARAEVEAYLARLSEGFCAIPPDLAEDTLAESLGHFLGALEPDSGAEDVAIVARALGEPDEYAAALCSALGGERAVEGSGSREIDDRSRGAGLIFGLPYDLRVPTAERVRSRWWNPADARLIVPKAFGVGWDVNFGALAVRLHLIRPDDEEVPFASAPDRALLAALLVPVALTALVAGLWLAFRSQLPPDLPSHWDAAGQPDRFWETGSSVAFHLAVSGVPTAWAVWTFVVGRSRSGRALVIALAGLFASIAAGTFASAVLWGLDRPVGWLVPASVFGGLALTFAMLVLLARASRRAEWTRELGEKRSRVHRPDADEPPPGDTRTDADRTP